MSTDHNQNTDRKLLPRLNSILLIDFPASRLFSDLRSALPSHPGHSSKSALLHYPAYLSKNILLERLVENSTMTVRTKDKASYVHFGVGGAGMPADFSPVSFFLPRTQSLTLGNQVTPSTHQPRKSAARPGPPTHNHPHQLKPQSPTQ